MAIASPDSEIARPPQRAQYADMNDWLNAMVDNRVQTAQAQGKPMSAEMAWTAANDHSIYQSRQKAVVAAVLALIVAGFVSAPSLPLLLGTFVALYLYVDFYSGVLHVVLDNPNFCDLPLVGVPCVEFQWHHTFAYDITTRKLTDVWGDLNVLLAMKCLFLFGIIGFNRTALMVAGVGFFWAYANQFAHRMAHTPTRKRPPVVRALHRAKLLVTPEAHREHHATYDTSFPVLSGLSRRLIEALLRWIPNQWVWLGTFLFLTAFDLVVATWLIQTYLPG